ncbi:MAG: hypothetical protein SCM11_06440 [Bacillota bacterium]|nr:hypothetical protein [Bacillota bacterium]
MLSFRKTIAFEAVAESGPDLEKNVRTICRRYFKNQNVLKRIADDIKWILEIKTDDDSDINGENPSHLWDDENEFVEGGINHSNETEVTD